MTVSSSNGGTTDPASAYPIQYLYNSIATVYAYPDPGYDFSGWLYDGWLQTSENPIQICMADDHTLYATFTPRQETHSLTVNGFCDSISSEVYPDVWIDDGSTWSGTAPVTFYDLPNTEHTITVSVPQDPYPNMEFSYMYYEGGVLYTNPATITLSGDYHITAYYYIPMFRQQEGQDG